MTNVCAERWVGPVADASGGVLASALKESSPPEVTTVAQASAMPNVFFAGVPKAGTSALAHCLARHPQFVVSAIKEPNYFNIDVPFEYFRTLEAYLALFRSDGTTPPLFRCDASILYCYSDVAAERIAAAVPGARAVVMLRDPIDVMHAWHGQMCYTGNEPLTNFAAALAAEAKRTRTRSAAGLVGLAARCPQLLWYRLLVDYAPQVQRFVRHLGQQNVLVLLYDDFAKDADATVDSVLRFLGADRLTRPGIDRVNEFKTRRWPRVHRFVKRVAAVPSVRLLPARWRWRLIDRWDALTSVGGKRAAVPANLRAQLARELRPSIEATAKLLDRDLSNWLR